MAEEAQNGLGTLSVALHGLAVYKESLNSSTGDVRLRIGYHSSKSPSRTQQWDWAEKVPLGLSLLVWYPTQRVQFCLWMRSTHRPAMGSSNGSCCPVLWVLIILPFQAGGGLRCSWEVQHEKNKAAAARHCITKYLMYLVLKTGTHCVCCGWMPSGNSSLQKIHSTNTEKCHSYSFYITRET